MSHRLNVVAWDTPSAVVVGKRFKMKIGIKCASECDLANRSLAVYDHDGKQIAASTLPAERWPGTDGLYAAEVELEAPPCEGL